MSFLLMLGQKLGACVEVLVDKIVQAATGEWKPVPRAELKLTDILRTASSSVMLLYDTIILR